MWLFYGILSHGAALTAWDWVLLIASDVYVMFIKLLSCLFWLLLNYPALSLASVGGFSWWSGSKAIQVLHKFPSFVPTGQLLRDVARRAIKQAQKIGETISDGLTMLLPYLSSQDGPIPSCFVVWLCAIYSPLPKANHQVRNIEGAQMHDVQACALWQSKSTRGIDTRKGQWLRYTSFQLLSMVLCLIQGCYKKSQIVLILLMGCLSDNPDIDIRMWAAFDVIVVWLEKHGEIVLFLSFVTPRQATVEMAAVLAVVPYKTSDVHHARSVRSDEGKKDPRFHFVLKHRVPDH